jgi:hypothetical protein
MMFMNRFQIGRRKRGERIKKAEEMKEMRPH